MPMWMKHLIAGGVYDARLFDAPNEGNPGGDAAAAEAAAAEAAAAEAAAAEAAAAEAAALEAAKAKPDDKSKPKPSDREAELLREVMAKKESERAAKAELEALRAKLGDVDPDTIAELVKSRKEAEKKDLEKRGEFDRLREMMAAEHERDTTSLKSENEALRAELNAAKATTDKLTVGNTFANSAFINKELVLAPAQVRRLYGDRFSLVDGVLVGFDAPEGTEGRTMMVDATGKPLPFDGALQRIIESDPEAASLKRAKIRPGGGGKTTESIKNETKPQGDGLRGASLLVSLMDKDAD